MPGRGGAGNFKAAVKNVDKQSNGSVRSLGTTSTSLSSSQRSANLKTKAGITIVQRPKAITFKSGRRGFAHTQVEPAPGITPPDLALTPPVTKFDLSQEYLDRNESSIGLATSAAIDSTPTPVDTPTASPARGGRGGIGNALHSPIKDSGQSIISSISGGSIKDRFTSDRDSPGLVDTQSRAIWVTTTITVDYAPIDVAPP